MMDLRIPLSCHALSNETNGNEGILAMVNFAKVLCKTTDLFYRPFAIQVVLQLHIMNYHFFQTAVTVFSIQTSGPKAKVIQFGVLWCPLLPGINFCIRWLSWNNKQSPNLSGLSANTYSLFTFISCWLLYLAGCLAVLTSAPGLRLKESLCGGHARSRVWRKRSREFGVTVTPLQTSAAK